LGSSARWAIAWCFAQAPAQAPTVPEFKDVRRNVGTFTARGGPSAIWSRLTRGDRGQSVRRHGADVPQRTAAKDVAEDRFSDQLASPSGPHGGNKLMQPNVGKIVAHVNVPGLQKKQAATSKSEDNQPTPTRRSTRTGRPRWEGDGVARYYGPAHTSGDIAITFENANIVHLGDLMSFQRNPRADRPAGASVPNWIPVLERIVKDHSNDTVYIFGHSKVGERVTGSSKDLMDLRNYFTALVDYAKKQIAAGKSQEEIVKGTMAIPGFEHYEGTPVALEAAVLELTGQRLSDRDGPRDPGPASSHQSPRTNTPD
jgi:hypothetical protein